MLMAFVTYVFALVFATGALGFLRDSRTLQHIEQEVDIDGMVGQFGSTANAMLTLYMSVTGGADWKEAYEYAHLMGFVYSCLFLVFTFIFGFAIFNIITAIIVEKAVAVMMPEMEDELTKFRRVRLNEEAEFRKLCEKSDIDTSGLLSFDTIKKMLQDPNVASFMEYIGASIPDVDAFYVLLAGSYDDEVEFEQFIRGCMSIKGAAKAVDLEKFSWDMKKHVKQLERMEVQCIEHVGQVKQLLEESIQNRAELWPGQDPSSSPERAWTKSTESTRTDDPTICTSANAAANDVANDSARFFARIDAGKEIIYI